MYYAKGFDQVWDDNYDRLIEEPTLQNVHRMQLLKMAAPTQVFAAKNAKFIFNIVRGCVMEQDTPLLQDTKSQETIGIGIYNSFWQDLKYILGSYYALTTSGIFCVVSCLNFFHYFRELNSTKIGDYPFSHYQIKENGFIFCQMYDEWVDNHLMDLLEVDLRVSNLGKRQYSMERFALKFCEAMKVSQMDGTSKMFEILTRMKELKLLDSFMDEILASPDLMQCVQYLLGDEDTNYMFGWTRFRELVDEKYVTAIIESDCCYM